MVKITNYLLKNKKQVKQKKKAISPLIAELMM